VSSKSLVGYVDIRVFAHATEDPEKVLTAVCSILPTELRETVVFQKANLTGHHGNPITLFKVKFADKQALPAVLRKIGSDLTALDKQVLERDIKLHLEKRDLYLRFDKQAAYSGELRFSKNDPIRFKVHFKNKAHEEIVEICRTAGFLP
jgi:RNA-binding protein